MGALAPIRPAAGRCAVRSLAGGFERVGQRIGSLGHRRIGRNEISQAVARAGVVEALDGGVKARPQLVRATSPGPGSQLIRWPGAIGTLHRAPRKPGLERASMRVAHRTRCTGQRAQAISKARVGGCELVPTHSARPRTLGVTDDAPRALLSGSASRLAGGVAHVALPTAPTGRRIYPHGPTARGSKPLLAAKAHGRQDLYTDTYGHTCVVSRIEQEPHR
jgi:hypothetical protein